MEVDRETIARLVEYGYEEYSAGEFHNEITGNTLYVNDGEMEIFYGDDRSPIEEEVLELLEDYLERRELWENHIY